MQLRRGLSVTMIVKSLNESGIVSRNERGLKLRGVDGRKGTG
jgi:hypothetical protein